MIEIKINYFKANLLSYQRGNQLSILKLKIVPYFLPMNKQNKTFHFNLVNY